MFVIPSFIFRSYLLVFYFFTFFMRRSFIITFMAFTLMGIVLAGCQPVENTKVSETVVTPSRETGVTTATSKPNLQENASETEAEKAVKKLGITTALPNGTVDEGFNLGSVMGEFSVLGKTVKIPPALMKWIEGRQERISQFTLPSYDSMYFVSTTSDLSVQPSDNVNRIYLFDPKAATLTLLYEEKNERILRLIGRDGSKLLVFADFIDKSPGPCAITWLMNNSTTPIMALELTDTKAGIQAYTVPAAQMEKAKKDELDCRKESGLLIEE